MGVQQERWEERTKAHEIEAVRKKQELEMRELMQQVLEQKQQEMERQVSQTRLMQERETAIYAQRENMDLTLKQKATEHEEALRELSRKHEEELRILRKEKEEFKTTAEGLKAHMERIKAQHEEELQELKVYQRDQLVEVKEQFRVREGLWINSYNMVKQLKPVVEAFRLAWEATRRAHPGISGGSGARLDFLEKDYYLAPDSVEEPDGRRGLTPTNGPSAELAQKSMLRNITDKALDGMERESSPESSPHGAPPSRPSPNHGQPRQQRLPQSPSTALPVRTMSSAAQGYTTGAAPKRRAQSPTAARRKPGTSKPS